MSEQDIDRVLAVLGRGETPTGLEQRVLARMAQTEAAPRGWLGGRGWLVVAGGMATALLVVGLTVGHRTRPVAAGPVVARAAVTAAVVEPVRAAGGAKKTARVRRVEFVRAEVTDAGGGEDAALLAEMRAPSHPAPPLPLTAGEKMLLRAARQPDSAELAMAEARLPEVRRDEERAFREYFVHPAFLVTPEVTNNK